jgi:hypothetical protein
VAIVLNAAWAVLDVTKGKRGSQDDALLVDRKCFPVRLPPTQVAGRGE